MCTRLQENGFQLNEEKTRQAFTRYGDNACQVIGPRIDRYVNAGIGARNTIEDLRLLSIAEDSLPNHLQVVMNWFSGTEFDVRPSLEHS